MPRIEVMGSRSDASKGDGHLATAIMSEDYGIANLDLASVDLPTGTADAIIYCRRDPGTLTEAAEYCARAHKPLIFMSSGIELPKIPWTFPMIVASNTSKQVVTWMLDSVDLSRQHPGWTPKIVEYHQATKKDVSGTAKAVLKMMNVVPDENNIKSVRKFKEPHEKFGIPESARGGYAAHIITFTNPETKEITEPLTVAIWGRREYAKGAIALSMAAIQRPNDFPDGAHTIFDLVTDSIFEFPADAA